MKKLRVKKDIVSCSKSAGIIAKAGDYVFVPPQKEENFKDGIIIVQNQKHGKFYVRLELLETD